MRFRSVSSAHKIYLPGLHFCSTPPDGIMGLKDFSAALYFYCGGDGFCHFLFLFFLCFLFQQCSGVLLSRCLGIIPGSASGPHPWAWTQSSGFKRSKGSKVKSMRAALWMNSSCLMINYWICFIRSMASSCWFWCSTYLKPCESPEQCLFPGTNWLPCQAAVGRETPLVGARWAVALEGARRWSPFWTLPSFAVPELGPLLLLSRVRLFSIIWPEKSFFKVVCWERFWR